MPLPTSRFPAEPYASVDDVCLERGQRAVLREITVSLHEHRIGLVGLNGAGKSTFLRLLNGLVRPDQGTVEVFGHDSVRDAKLLPRLVGMMFQNPDHQIIFPTVLEEIAFAPRQFGASKCEAESAARQVLRAHGCEDWAERPVSLLSEGQKQLVCLLAVVVVEPRLLLLDEPFANLDPALRLHFHKLMMQLPQKLVLISHDLDCLDGFDRILWFDAGRIIGDGAPEEILPRFRAHAQERAARLSADML